MNTFTKRLLVVLTIIGIVLFLFYQMAPVLVTLAGNNLILVGFFVILFLVIFAIAALIKRIK